MRAFVCKACGETAEHLMDFHDETCPPCECGGETVRNYAMEGMGQRPPTGVFDKPIEMHSVALDSDEVSAFRKACPGIEVASSGPMMGVPIVKTRSEKLRVLKTMGYQENN